MKPLRIGSRGSALALWQAEFVRRRLGELAGRECEVVVIKTSGDRHQQAAVASIGLKGIFTKEIEDALLDRRVELAVHSLKDVPTETTAGLVFPAICEREDPRDCLVAAAGVGLADLPRGARVGTSSLRRQAQLRHHRPDLELIPLRGNVDTRLRKLDAGEFDAIVLAKAGLDRLGRSDRITEILPAEICLPAVGQGALALEARADDEQTCRLAARLDHPATRTAVTAERALLAELQGGCQVPVGAWARIEGGRVRLEACVLSPDGADCVRDAAEGPAEEPEALGRSLGRKLIERGAARLLALAGRSIDA